MMEEEEVNFWSWNSNKRYKTRIFVNGDELLAIRADSEFVSVIINELNSCDGSAGLAGLAGQLTWANG